MGGQGSGRARLLVPGTRGAREILTAIDQQGLTLEEFAAKAGVDVSGLHRLLKDEDPNTGLRILRRITQAAGKSLDIWM